MSIEDLSSNHTEADHRIALHVMYASSNGDKTCAVADETDVYILLLYVTNRCNGQVYMRQGTTDSKDGILYHDVHA